MASEDLVFPRGERCWVPEHGRSPLSSLQSSSKRQRRFEGAWNHDERVHAAHEYTSFLPARPSTPKSQASELALRDVLRSGFRTPKKPTQARRPLSPLGFNNPAWYPIVPSQARSRLDLVRPTSAGIGSPLRCPTTPSHSRSGKVEHSPGSLSPSYRPESPIDFENPPWYHEEPFRSDTQKEGSSPSYRPRSPIYFSEISSYRTNRAVPPKSNHDQAGAIPSYRPKSPLYFDNSQSHLTDPVVSTQWEHNRAEAVPSYRPGLPTYYPDSPWYRTDRAIPSGWEHNQAGTSPSYRPDSPTVFDDSLWYHTDREIPSELESNEAPSQADSDRAEATPRYVQGSPMRFHSPLRITMPSTTSQAELPTPPLSAKKQQHHLSDRRPIPKQFWYISSQATYLPLLPTLRNLTTNPNQPRSDPLETLQTSLYPQRFEAHWSNNSPLPDPRSTIVPLYTTHATAIQHAREHHKHLQQNAWFAEKDVCIRSTSTGCLNWSTLALANDPRVDVRVLTTVPYLGEGKVAVISGSEARRMVPTEHVVERSKGMNEEEEWFALGRIPDFMFAGMEKFEPAAFI